MSHRLAALAALSAATLACDGQQYVNPDTVALVVTDTETKVQRVNRCHYVPVLLGSEVKARYLVEDSLRVTISVTRDDVDLVFEDAGAAVSSFHAFSAALAEEAGELRPDAPEPYSARLVWPCKPDDR